MKPGGGHAREPTSTPTAQISNEAGGRRISSLETAGVAGWLLLFVVACVHFAWTTSPSFDEPGLIHAGYANLTEGATKSSTGNLIFAQNWSALPLLATRPVLPSAAELQAVEPLRREFGRLFLFHPANEWSAILRSGRAMTIILGVALALIVYGCSRRCFGVAGAQVSLGFYCLSPVVLANSSLATTDLAAALWFTVAVNRWWAVLHRVTLCNVIVCGVATGLLLVTKFSSFAIFPMVVILAVARVMSAQPLLVAWPRSESIEISSRRRQLVLLFGAAVAVGVVSVVTIWLSYVPQLTLFAEHGASPVPWDKLPRDGWVTNAAIQLHRFDLLPEPYLLDLWVFGSSTGGRRAFLLGDYSVNGWWYFFPVAWWFKTPIPFMIALVLAGVACARRWSRTSTLVPLLVLVVVYVVMAMLTTLNIGIRHMLPVYPALFVIAGGVCLLPWRKRILPGVVIALLAWSVVELWPVRSQFLAYFNAFAGGPRDGHRVLVDSSYEWGQDLPAVETWLAERAQQRETKPPVYFSYFGNADLSRFRINAVLLPQFFDLRPVKPYELTAGTYLISATMLRSVYGPLFGPWRASYESVYQSLLPEMLAARRGETLSQDQLARVAFYDALRFGRLCAYLRRRAPNARVTHGILVFELSEQELNTALRQPIAEAESRYQIPGTEHLPQAGLEFLK